jgi:dienelactone hydrolase
MHTETIDYADGSTKLEGFLAYDATIKGKRPAVIVCHAWAGRDEFAQKKAEALGQLGYVGFALDMYGKGKRGANNDENAKLMGPFVQDRELLDRRVNAAANEVRKHLMVDAKQIGAMGFCFGGMCALDLARSGPEGLQGVVSVHGLLTAPPKRRAKKISANILALHGYSDPMAPPDQMKAFCDEMVQAGADLQLHAFGHCVHAFTNPMANDRAHGMEYDAVAEKRSWALIKGFFDEVFA